MSDKLSESSWKEFLKKQKLAMELEDKDLLKVLARIDKADERKHEVLLDALKDLAKEIPKQVTALVRLKKQLDEKSIATVKDRLYEMLEEAESQKKKTESKLEALQAQDDEEDDDSKPNALMDPKLLLKQLTICRKNPERTMKFAFVDAKDKQPAVLAMHPRMSARALFGKLQTAAGLKSGAFGSAWVEQTTLMLQLDKPLSGLVKRVRAPVKACGFRITKAVLWNEDGTVFEQDEQHEESVAEEVAPGLRSAQAQTDAAASTAPPQPATTFESMLAQLQPRVRQAAEAGSLDAAKHQKLMEFAAGKVKGDKPDFLAAIAALRQVEHLLDGALPKSHDEGIVDAGSNFKARLTALIPRIKEAQVKELAGAQEAKVKASEAGVFAGKRDFERANSLLNEVEAALTAGVGRSPAPIAARTGTASDFPQRWSAAMEHWRDASDKVDAQIVRLQTALRRLDDDDLHEIADAGLNGITAGAKVGLLVAFREISVTKGPPSSSQVDKARKAVASFLAQIETDPRVKACDINPFGVPVSLRATLVPALDELDAALRYAPTQSTAS